MLRPIVVLLAACGFAAPAQEPPAQSETGELRQYRVAVPGVRGVATTGHPLASSAALRILIRGGTAIDAAVAAMATLNVVEPWASGAGGNGFLTYYDKSSGKVYSLSMTGAAPKALQPERMTAETLGAGVQAAIVPGMFGGWIAAMERFGVLTLAEVLEPAMEYAAEGHPLDPAIARSIRGRMSLLARFPTSAAIFLPEGRAPAGGEIHRNLPLAATFRKLVEAEQSARRQGKSRSEALRAAFDRFYKGDIAREFAAFFRNNDGLLSAADFAAYQPKWTDPLHTTYHGYDVYSNPSTSRGGFELLMQLNLIEAYNLKPLGHNSSEALHLIAECIKLAKADVYQYVADPAFTKIPVSGMLSKEYAGLRRKMIDRSRAMVYPEPGDPGRAPQSSQAARGPRFDETSWTGSTTSLSVADRHGNAVAVTPTLGSGFGTGVVVGNTGLLFNNGMRIGSTSPYPGHLNYVRGGQVPLLNNSPVIVLKDGKFFMAFGTPGGETIGQTQFQLLLNVVDFGMGIQEAIEAPRIALEAEPNFYKPGVAITVRAESRVRPDVVRGLERLGHVVRPAAAYSLGNIQGILADPQTGVRLAGADLRRTAYAAGW